MTAGHENQSRKYIEYIILGPACHVIYRYALSPIPSHMWRPGGICW